MSLIKHSKPSFSEEEEDAVQRVLASGSPGPGEEVEAFEEEFADEIGVSHAIATSTGTAALHLALISLEIDPEDRVVLPSYAWATMMHAIHYRDATPRTVEVDSDTYNIDPYSIKGVLEPETKAIIVAHMFGHPAPVDEILELGLPVIEECSMAPGTELHGKNLGSIGDVAVASFDDDQFLSTGTGGILLTDDEEIYNNASDLVSADRREEYRVRYDYKMNNVQAAIGRVQLQKLDEFTERRRELAKNYLSALQEAPVGLPVDRTEGDHVYHEFVIGSGPMDRHVMENYFLDQDIEIKGPVYKPLHRYVRLSDEDFPNTTSAFRQNVSLPMYPALTNEEQQKVIETLFEFAEDEGVL